MNDRPADRSGPPPVPEPATSGPADVAPAPSKGARDGPPPRGGAARGALVMMGGTLGSRVTGLLRHSLMVQLFPPAVTDAFLVALRVPNLFRELLAEGALTNSFVPVYRGLPPVERGRLAAALLGLLVLANGLLTALAVALAGPIVDLLLGGSGSVDRDLAVRLTRAVFAFLPMISLSAWAMGILQAEERFLAPAWAPVALNVVAVVLMLALPGAALPLALAFVLGGAAQFAVQLPALARAGALPRFAGLWHPELTAVLLLMVPFAFTTSARQFLNVVATNLLDDLSASAVTAFSNADLFLSLALGLFSISPALSYYARLSAEAAEAPERTGATLGEGLRLILFLCAPAGALLALLAGPAVRVVFDWLEVVRPGGGADEPTLLLSAAALAPLGLAVPAIGLNNLLVRAFYVRRETRMPILSTVGFVAVSAAGYALLAPRWGIAGMSWATAAAGWLQLAALLWLVERRERFGLRRLLASAARVALATLLAAAATWALLRVAPWPAGWWGELARAVAGTLAFGVVYAGAGTALGMPELAATRRRFGRR